MIDFDVLVMGLDELGRDEIRHVVRHVMATLGDPDVGLYDPSLARAALGRLTAAQYETLVAYCRRFLVPTPDADLACHLSPTGFVGYDSPDLRG